MKKIILFLGLVCTAAVTFAQVAATPVPTLITNQTGVTAGLLRSTLAHVATDTVANSTAKEQFATIQGWQDYVEFQTRITKIGGTPTGSVKLYGSLDGVAYEQIGTDSLAITNVATAQSKIWKITPSQHVYFKLTALGSGTWSAKMNSVWITRRKPVGSAQ